MNSAPANLIETAAALRRGSLTVPDLLHRCRQNIARLNDKLNAVITLTQDAESTALRLEEELRGGRDYGPLHGIPLLVKDNIDVEGLPTTVASPIFAAAPAAARDAAVIEGLRRAGAIILGKTNMDEFAAHVSGRTSCWGPTVNPWHMSRHCSPGGSSSGSAAAVAAGMCCAALGTDTGGSIRLPAGWCGLFGLRPSWGLLPMRGIYPRAASMDVPGLLTVSAADMQLLLRAMLQGDPPAAPLPERPRLGVMRALVRQEAAKAQAAIADRYEASIERWAALGCEVTDVDFPLLVEDGIGGIVDSLRSHEFHRDVRGDVEGSPARNRMHAIPAADYAAGRDMPPEVHAAAETGRRELGEATQAFFTREKLCALLLPTAFLTAPRLDAPNATYREARLLMNLFSMTGNPVLVYPGGLVDGMPCGMQLVGQPGSDACLLELAERYERRYRPFAAPEC
ncbi:MAG TPA: amidase [Candidatus Desulfovibrio intestinavium]|uniref:Amidase n=1 Tax=Candidatus Desulfovibrio intestinavium TaxID=2838534 RepID=A0A9D2HL00_9BACT|nr:amidase [Candidatus Desulfovibrio intestinavium]